MRTNYTPMNQTTRQWVGNDEGYKDFTKETFGFQQALSIVYGDFAKEFEIDEDIVELEEEDSYDECSYCSTGCNYCLMI